MKSKRKSWVEAVLTGPNWEDIPVESIQKTRSIGCAVHRKFKQYHRPLVPGRGVFKRNLDEDHQGVRKASKAYAANRHEYGWQRPKFSMLATDVWVEGKKDYPKRESKSRTLLKIASSQIDARWNKRCEAWQNTQRTSIVREIWACSGYVPDCLGANYLDPEVIHACELLPNTSCWSVNEAINLGRAPHNTAVEFRDKSVSSDSSVPIWIYTSCSHYHIHLCSQMLHNQREFNNSLHIGTQP